MIYTIFLTTMWFVLLIIGALLYLFTREISLTISFIGSGLVVLILFALEMIIDRLGAK